MQHKRCVLHSTTLCFTQHNAVFYTADSCIDPSAPLCRSSMLITSSVQQAVLSITAATSFMSAFDSFDEYPHDYSDWSMSLQGLFEDSVDGFSQITPSLQTPTNQAPTLSAAAAAAADKENVSAPSPIKSTGSNSKPPPSVQSKMTAFYQIQKDSTTAKKRKQSEVSFYRCSNGAQCQYIMYARSAVQLA
jgi:hypothetical protein